MKIYESSGYQIIGGAHHDIVPNGSLISWDESSIAVFPVKTAGEACAQVICTLQTGGFYKGTKDDESYTFSPPAAGPMSAERIHGPVDTDTGSFTATEIHPLDTEE